MRFPGWVLALPMVVTVVPFAFQVRVATANEASAMAERLALGFGLDQKCEILAPAERESLRSHMAELEIRLAEQSSVSRAKRVLGRGLHAATTRDCDAEARRIVLAALDDATALKQQPAVAAKPVAPAAPAATPPKGNTSVAYKTPAGAPDVSITDTPLADAADVPAQRNPAMPPGQTKTAAAGKADFPPVPFEGSEPAPAPPPQNLSVHVHSPAVPPADVVRTAKPAAPPPVAVVIPTPPVAPARAVVAAPEPAKTQVAILPVEPAPTPVLKPAILRAPPLPVLKPEALQRPAPPAPAPLPKAAAPAVQVAAAPRPVVSLPAAPRVVPERTSAKQDAAPLAAPAPAPAVQPVAPLKTAAVRWQLPPAAPLPKGPPPAVPTYTAPPTPRAVAQAQTLPQPAPPMVLKPQAITVVHAQATVPPARNLTIITPQPLPVAAIAPLPEQDETVASPSESEQRASPAPHKRKQVVRERKKPAAKPKVVVAQVKVEKKKPAPRKEQRVAAKTTKPARKLSTDAPHKERAQGYASLAEDYYVELRCRVLSIRAVRRMYARVLTSHRQALASQGGANVRTLLRNARARAGSRHCG